MLTKDGAVLCVFVLGISSQYGTEAVVVDLVLVGHHELTPPLLSLGALHFVLDDGLGGVELGEVFAEMFVNIVIYLGQAQCAALDFFENGPVGLEVLDGYDSTVSETENKVLEQMATHPLLRIASQSVFRTSAKENHQAPTAIKPSPPQSYQHRRPGSWKAPAECLPWRQQ